MSVYDRLGWLAMEWKLVGVPNEGRLKGIGGVEWTWRAGSRVWKINQWGWKMNLSLVSEAVCMSGGEGEMEDVVQPIGVW